jgi:CDP-diglyceride synthetase
MNVDFKKRQASFLIQIAMLTIVLLGAHYYILHYFAKDINLFFPLWQVYLFQIVVTVFLYTVVNYKYTSKNTDIFKFFMIATFLKMALAMILSKTFENKQADVFNFFIPYFIYLFFEVFSLTKFLQKA